MKNFLLTSLLVLIYISAYSQKPKEIKEMNLKTKTTWVTEKKGKKELNYKALELRYDKDGNLIQEIVFNPKGDITKNISYQYENERKVRELRHDPEGKIILRIEYVYSRSKSLSEIQYYNEKNELIKKEQFIYEQQD
jgi:hypothetical protein